TVSKASDDLPEPLTPVTTVREFTGIANEMFLRLLTRAPRTMMLSRSDINYSEIFDRPEEGRGSRVASSRATRFSILDLLSSILVLVVMATSCRNFLTGAKLQF